MNIIAETELILTPENRIYHLNLCKDDIANDIILVGDPERVTAISRKFDNIECKIEHREFITHTGTYNKKRITVISTGIGPDNIDIVINELDALANIDFKKRIVNSKRKSLNIIRLGTSGALQADIEIDKFVTSSFALGLDNLAHFYDTKNLILEDISKKYLTHTNWPKELSRPYVVKASEKLISLFEDLDTGITATAPGFYGPQGRVLRLETSMPDLHKNMESFRYKKYRIINFEMETSALYLLGRLLGHKTLTICAIIGNRVAKKYSKKMKDTIDNMIQLTLDRLTAN